MIRAKIIRPNPNPNINHFKNFFEPRSLEILNKSKSLDPTIAPENELESGDIIMDTIMIMIEKLNNTQINAIAIVTPLNIV